MTIHKELFRAQEELLQLEPPLARVLVLMHTSQMEEIATLGIQLGQTLTAVGELTQTMTAVLAKVQEQLASQRQKD